MSLDWGQFSIALVDVITGNFVPASLLYDLVQRDNLANSLAMHHDGSQAMTGDLDMDSNQIINCAKLIFDATVGTAIVTNDRDIDLGTGTVNGNVSPGRAYYFGQFAVQNTWYPMVGADATGLDWRGVRVAVQSTYDTSDPGDWIGVGVDSFGGGVLVSGVANKIMQDVGIHSLEIRANSSTGALEARRTGSNSNYNYISVFYVNTS